MATTVDLGKVTGPQGPRGIQGPQGPQGDSYITKYVVNASNKTVQLPVGVYAVQTSTSGREQIIVKFNSTTISVQSLCVHKNAPDVKYGVSLTPDNNIHLTDCIVLEQPGTATAQRVQGTACVTFYKIA